MKDILDYYWINEKRNTAKALSKHWGYVCTLPYLKVLLDEEGDTGQAPGQKHKK